MAEKRRLSAAVGRPSVEILGFAGCPNVGPARRLVERVARGLRLEPQLELLEVSDADAAARLRFLGSPSVRVDGVDVEPGAETRGEHVFACRVYRTAEGLTGLPAEEWVRDALARGAAGRRGPGRGAV